MIRPLSRVSFPLIHSRWMTATSTPFSHSNPHESLGPVVRQALKNRIASIDSRTCQPGEEDAFFVADLGLVTRQHELWCSSLPRVKAHYAIKCNPDTEIIRHLANLGTGFDCASKSELEQVLDIGVDPTRIIYANPAKAESCIRYATSKGVTQMTFDNVDELYKIKRSCPNAELLLRIMADDSTALCPLSTKYGAPPDSTSRLLETASGLSLNVVGVSFHVGSRATDASVFARTINDARMVFDQAADMGLCLRTLDLGGGFSSTTFPEMADVICKALDESFPSNTLNIIGEPGRFYVESAFTLACHIIARSGNEPERYKLYLNDGVYGNFSGVMFDHQKPVPKVLRDGPDFLPVRPRCRKPLQYSLWGPTCDGLDLINPECYFKETLDAGDWLYFENMGAYTKCSATRFNSFNDDHDVLYVNDKPSDPDAVEKM